MYDILLKNGEVIDPSQGIHKKGSVAIQDGKIAAVLQNISDSQAKKVLDMEGKIIAPGLIDIHCHPVGVFAFFGVPADEIGLNTGVTLLCDAGTSGAANFETMRRFVVEPAKTEIYCFLNLSTTGQIKMPEIWSEHDIDVNWSKQVIEANRDVIKGVKVRAIQAMAEGMGVKGIEMAKKLAGDVGLPLMVHLGEKRDRFPGDKMDDFSRAAVSLLEKGDHLDHYLTWQAGGMILKDGTIFPELEAAQKRDVTLDPCLGSGNYNFANARLAIAKGLIPTVISTDMSSIGLPVVQSLPVSMSKFLNLGLTLDQVIEMTTISPAKALREEKKRGSLTVGMNADISVMELSRGDYVFAGDINTRETMRGTMLLEPRMVFKTGKAMPAYSRYHLPPF
jgi:dihydroorotase